MKIDGEKSKEELERESIQVEEIKKEEKEDDKSDADSEGDNKDGEADANKEIDKEERVSLLSCRHVS